MSNLQSDRDRVLEATDLVAVIGEHVPLKKKGREFVGLCPFHDDRTPSMHVVPHKGIYKCFACGAGHNAIDFVMNFHRMEFLDALRFLAQRAGIVLEERQPSEVAPGSRKVDLLEANKVAQAFFRAMLKKPETGESARQVIAERGIAPEVAEAFGLGVAPNQWDGLLSALRSRGYDLAPFHAAGLLRESTESGRVFDYFRNRLIFPICDQLGRPIAFGARKLDPADEPKYLNSPESTIFAKSRTLYGLHLARKAIGDLNTAIVCEGYTDVIALHQAGITHAVASLGTALTADHARVLQRLCNTVVLLFDGDEAGQKAAERAVEVFFSEPIDVKICVLPGGQDPDELLRAEGGREALLRAVERAEDALSYLVARFRAELDETASLSGRQKLMQGFLERLSGMGFHAMPGVRKRLVLPVLAQALKVGVRDLEAMMPKPRVGRAVERWESSSSSSDEQALSDVETTDPARRPAERALRQSEFDLLALLLHEPTARQTPVDAGDGHLLPVTELFLPESLNAGELRVVYHAMHELIESGDAFTIHDLMRELAPSLHAIISDLAFRGETLAGEDAPRAIELLRQTCRALLQLTDREAARRRFDELRRDDAPANALFEAIEQRRRLGSNPAALHRGLRS